MHPEHIWLLSGYAGSGKDTAATFLQTILGQATISSFAGAVKDEVATMYEFDRAYLDTQEGKARVIRLADGRNVTIRDLIIAHAETTKQKEGDSAVWAKRIRDPNTNHWILSDWRFLDELVSLRFRFPKARIHTVRIIRPCITPLASHTEHELDAHVFEHVLRNEGSLAYLASQVERMVAATLAS